MRSCQNPLISVIIPSNSEAHHLNRILPFLRHHGGRDLAEVIVVDTGPSGYTEELCYWHYVVFMHTEENDMAHQMNLGAERATGDILYFLRPDSLPPASFAFDILENYGSGNSSGCFQVEFDKKTTFYKLSGILPDLAYLWYNEGEETLYISKERFIKTGGFKAVWGKMSLAMMLATMKSKGDFITMPKKVLISSESFERNGYLNLMWSNYRNYRHCRKSANS